MTLQLTADTVAQALVHAAITLGVPPPEAFADGIGLAPSRVRVLAGAGLRAADASLKATRVSALVAVGPQQLAPSMLRNGKIKAAHVDAVAKALRAGLTPPIQSPAAKSAPSPALRQPPASARETAAPVAPSRPAPPSPPGHAPTGQADGSRTGGGGNPVGEYLKPPPADAEVVRPSPHAASRQPVSPPKNLEAGQRARAAGLMAAEADFVRRKRAAGAPWSHIAQQLAVSELGLRRRHDRDRKG